MKLSTLTVMLLCTVPVLALGGTRGTVNQCLTCHQTLGDKPSALYTHDVHFARGITCAGCHGGNAASDDMEKAMDKSAGFIGAPKGNAISEACARCHADGERMKQYGSSLPTDQFSQLQKSVHGKIGVSGDEHIAQCTSCHGAHGIVSAKDPKSPVYSLNVVKTCASCHANVAYMKRYNPSLPVDQMEKYQTSVHGMRNAKGDTKAAECASCHGSHSILPPSDVNSLVYRTTLPQTCAQCHSRPEYMKEYGIPTDQYFGFARSVHGVALLQKHDAGAPSCNSCHGNHGATPPGVESVSMVCGTCHALNADLFSASPHKKAFDERHLPECATCHGNHDIIAATHQLLGSSKEAACSRCHSASQNPQGYAAAVAMRALIDSLDTSEQAARTLVDEAEQKGMEISEAKFKLREVRQARMESRTVVHAFDPARFREVADKGLKTASTVRLEAGDAVQEYYFRRVGLGVATLIITVLVVALYIYIRRLERRPQAATALHHEAGR